MSTLYIYIYISYIYIYIYKGGRREGTRQRKRQEITARETTRTQGQKVGLWVYVSQHLGNRGL